ncbi:MAG: condensation domain-containing protein, partial [Arcicella sp.]|nr:condensation domain-containing protein [Arcicella sp.]
MNPIQNKPLHTKDIGSRSEFLREDKSELIKRLLAEKRMRENGLQRMSYNQESLWIINQTFEGNTAYNVGFAVKITSKFDVEVFRKVFQEKVDFHQILRTNFVIQDDVPCQKINTHQEVIIHQIEASGWTREDVYKSLKLTYQLPFDLENEPVFRIHVFKVNDDETILLLNFHHIAVDAYSLVLLVQEILESYDSFENFTLFRNSQVDESYINFVKKQQQIILGEEGKKLKKYWQNQLLGEIPTLNLPNDQQRPALPSLFGNKITFELNRGLYLSLKAFSKANNCTLYTTLLSIFQVFLYRISGQDDIIVGSPVSSGRLNANFSKSIGHFVNLLPMRADFTESKDFVGFLKTNKETILSAFQHQEYPFLQLVKDLDLPRNTNVSPVFQVLFNYLNLEGVGEIKKLFMPNPNEEAYSYKNLTLIPLDLPQLEGQYDTSLELCDDGEKMVGLWKYNTQLFSHERAEQLLSYFQNILNEIVENPTNNIDDLSLLNPETQLKLLSHHCHTFRDYSFASTLVSMFERSVACHPTSIAL